MMKVLLAVDGSPSSDAAVAEVCRRPWPTGTEVHVVIVDRPVEPSLLKSSPTIFDEIVKQQRSDALRHLTSAVETLESRSPGLRVGSMLLEGYPKEAIVEEAERWGADLIVLGSHGYGPVKRFLLGSVSLAVATSAPCSVHIVRRAAAGPDDQAQS